MRVRANSSWLSWFLLGLGSQLQIVASLSFTELFVLLSAPCLFFREIPYLRRNGVMPAFWFASLTVVGCFLSCVANRTPFAGALRGMAVTVLLPCSVVVMHWQLRRNMAGLKWWFVGGALSMFLCTFWFQHSVELTMLADGASGIDAVQDIVSGPIYWVVRLGTFLSAIVKGWYLQLPSIFAVGVPLFLFGFALLTTTSGRSAALGAIGSAALVLLGGRTQQSMRRVGRYFILTCICAVTSIFLVKFLYRVSAQSGWLGEEAREKYEKQTKGDHGLMALLLGGRMESFTGLLAIRDRPFLGFGPWPSSDHDYAGEFLQRYGNMEDYQNYLDLQAFYAKGNRLGGRFGIPCHSTIVQFFVWYGLLGGLFWVYFLFIAIQYLRKNCWVIPQWYFCLGAVLPSVFWSVFFSPFADRVGSMLLIVCWLMTRAVRQGKQQLPMEMIREIK